MPETKNQSGVRMWPFAGMSLEAASDIGAFANLALLLSLITGLIATFFIVKTTDVKEEHWAESRRVSNERVANAELEASKLRTDNIFIESTLLPRRWLDAAQRGSSTAEGTFELLEVWSRVGDFAGTTALIQVVPDFEARRLSIDIHSGLGRLGWETKNVDISETHILDVWVPDGIEIWTAPRGTSATSDRAWDAAEALAASMTYQNIKTARNTTDLHKYDPTERLWTLPGDIRANVPDGAVVILIGPKPAWMPLMERETNRANPGK